MKFKTLKTKKCIQSSFILAIFYILTACIHTRSSAYQIPQALKNLDYLTLKKTYLEQRQKFAYQDAFQTAQAWHALAPNDKDAFLANIHMHVAMADLSQDNARSQKLIEDCLQLIEQEKTKSSPHPQPWILELDYVHAEALGIKAKLASVGQLSMVAKMVSLLEPIVQKNPDFDQGQAVRFLGLLLIKIPAWPLSQGDSERGLLLLETSYFKYPYRPESLLYYVDGLLSLSEKQKAQEILQTRHQFVWQDPRHIRYLNELMRQQ